MISTKTTENAVGVLKQFTQKLKISVTSFTIEKELKEHPDYPSLLSLSDCLNSWNIPNEAFEVNKNHFNPTELPFPFIANLKSSGGRFILLNNSL